MLSPKALCLGLASLQSPLSSQCPWCSEGGPVSGTDAGPWNKATVPFLLCDSGRALRLPRAEGLPAQVFILKLQSALRLHFPES